MSKCVPWLSKSSSQNGWSFVDIAGNEYVTPKRIGKNIKLNMLLQRKPFEDCFVNGAKSSHQKKAPKITGIYNLSIETGKTAVNHFW